MKVQQENLPFRAITIKLGKRSEAVALFGLVDKIENFRCNEGQELNLIKEEIALVIELSNLNTNMEIKF